VTFTILAEKLVDYGVAADVGFDGSK